MLLMPASAAASHGHEHSPSSKPGMANPNQDDPGLDLFTPLRYLHGRWQALTGPTAPADSKPATLPKSPPPTPDAPTSHAHDGVSEASCSASVASTLPAGDCSALPPSVACSKTSYQLCHPPPKAGRFRVRRRLLLQLRRASKGQRAVPVLELFTTNALSRTLTKSRSRKQGPQSLFSYDDLVISSCESYRRAQRETEAAPEDYSDEEGFDQRGVVASIHQGPKITAGGKLRAEIRIGSELWHAAEVPTGYEFSSADEHGEAAKVRWITKSNKKRSQSDPPPLNSLAASQSKPKGFKFILVNPNGRQHPVVAYLDRASLSVMDQYIVPGAPSSLSATADALDSSRPPSIATTDSSALASHFIAHPAPGSVVATADATRTLALVTGVWIALAEGWLPSCPAPPAGAALDATAPASAPLQQRAASTPSARAPAGLVFPPQTVSLPNTPQLRGAATSTAPPTGRAAALVAEARTESAPSSPVRASSESAGPRPTRTRERRAGSRIVHPPPQIAEVVDAGARNGDADAEGPAANADGLTEGTGSSRPSEDSAAGPKAQTAKKRRGVRRRLLSMVRKRAERSADR